MNSPALERFLARLYVEDKLRKQFLASPYEESRRAGLSEEQAHAMMNIDRLGLEMAAHSFSAKRARKSGRLKNH